MPLGSFYYARKGWYIMKYTLFTVIGVIGSFVANLFGGWDMALQTLIMFMAVDYITGLMVAGVFKKSPKTANGALESKAGWKGLCRKGMTLLIVLVAAQIDNMTGANIIRNAVIIGYVSNEALSILENAGLMGLPIPEKLKNAISVLKGKGDPE
jgi:toxin secretion/phage lysis holin